MVALNMEIKKKALTAIAGVSLVVSVATPTLIASTALVTVGTTNEKRIYIGRTFSGGCDIRSISSTWDSFVWWVYTKQ